MANKRWTTWTAYLAVAAAGATAGSFTTAHYLHQPQEVIDAYHRWYHANGPTTYNDTHWLGVETQKSPLDMWVLEEILYEVKPDVLVEAGTYLGGSAYYFASLFDMMNHGRVVTIDIEDHPGKPQHPRIQYLLGSSTSAGIVEQVRASIQPGETVLVDLDSDHHMPHVLNELNLYSPMVTPGSYLVVEDMHFNGHPILPTWGPGPSEAVAAFLPSHPEFQPDHSREKFGMTFNRGGYLKRVR